MSKWDFEIALLAWLAMVACAIYAAFSPTNTLMVALIGIAVVASSFNLWHQRQTLYRAGDEFDRRVKTLVAADYALLHDRLATLERGVKEVREIQGGIGHAQNRMMSR